MHNKLIYLLILLGICVTPIKADELNKGLYFRSFEVDKDKRTCLDLTPQKPLSFPKGFSMDFDLHLRPERHNFGYIFRIIGNDTLNIDLLSDITSEEANFMLVAKNKAILQYLNHEIGDTIENKWIRVSLTIDPVNHKISISLNNAGKETEYRLNGLKYFKIYFGGNMHDIFSTTDIAPMRVKNIRFTDEKPKPVRYWELGKHSNNYIYDEYISDKAIVQNPVWEINRHAQWRGLETLVCPGMYYQIAFDQRNGRIFMIRNKDMYVYHTKDHKTDTIHVTDGVPFNVQSNQIVYDPNRDILISYDFEKQYLATFDFTSQRWSNHYHIFIQPKYAHHSRAFLTGDSLLVMFGGYGFHRYHSLLNEYSMRDNSWKVYDLSASIDPRYLGSMGYWGNGKLLYFGGYGNKSGRQEEFPRNYYDLYFIDTKTREVKKLWELPNRMEHFTNSNSLVIDQNDLKKFYALAYPNKRYASVISLHEYSTDAPGYRNVGDSIPYFFNDVESYCDLFCDSAQSELYAVTAYVKEGNSEINIYSISYPPISPEDVFQQIPSESNACIWMLSILTAGIAGFGVYCCRKKKHIKADKDNIIPDIEEIPVPSDLPAPERKTSSVYLLGNFIVIDDAGNDISAGFTPTITQLFLLLLLSTIKNGQGISSQELRMLLWYDKDDDSARNNRNVYMNKLRSILKSIANIKVINQDGYWSIPLDREVVFCDYERILLSIRTLQTNTPFNKELLNEVLDFVLRGTLLPYVQQTTWLEAYQSEFSNFLIESLLEFSTCNEVKSDLLVMLKTADAILLHDNIDENAIRLKCYALFHSGRKNQALQAFNKFTADYESLLATSHHLTFEELVG